MIINFFFNWFKWKTLSPIKHEDKSNYLPFIFGKPEIDQFLKFKKKLMTPNLNIKTLIIYFFFHLIGGIFNLKMIY